MLRLGILGLGLVTAMVVLDCGGRTPLQDEDLFGSPGLIGTSGGSGTTTTGSGTSGTSVVVGNAGNGFGGSTSTGVGGNPGGAGTSVGAAGSVIVGTGGSTGFGGTGAAGSGVGGFAGAGGSVIGSAGTTGMGGAGGGPALVRRLVDELPGTRPNADCIGCASMCQGSARCAANPVCVAGLACATANCGMQNNNPGGQCLLKCVGGDPQAFAQAVTALLCVYDTCGRSCTAPRMR